VRLRSMSIVLALSLGCTSEREAPATPAASALYRPEQAAVERRIGFDAAGRPTAARLEEVVVTAAALPMPDETNMVIRTADASIEVDSLEPAVAEVHQLAARVGGFIANTEMQAGAGQLRSATIEIKVPAPRFDDALAGLRPIGKVESVNVAAEDVGEEFVDVSARMENSRRLERRLIDLLASRTGKLKDVLDVEQALARVREEIERYEGRLRYLQAHTATSTLSVRIHEPVPIVGSAGSSVMGEAFRQSWRNFVALVALLVQSLGVVLPLGALAAAGWVATRRWRRPLATVRASSRAEA
jgi:hypothetical protein